MDYPYAGKIELPRLFLPARPWAVNLTIDPIRVKRRRMVTSKADEGVIEVCCERLGLRWVSANS